eukprot:gene6503-8940_t
MSAFSRFVRTKVNPKLYQPLNCSPLSSGAGIATSKKKKEESKYSKTVILPQTTFDQRANSLAKEPAMQKWWSTYSIYEKLSESNVGEKFILHDGPPYANGNLHIGHALNKILKDFINKYQILKGKKVRYVPGWDCHGLPIELKVLQSMKTKERELLTPITLRKKAAEFAKSTMASQKEAFKRYGIWGDWDKPYLTLQPEYEAAQVRVFGEMVTNGHIYRGKKPVHWSPSSRTALAEAELEYPENHISKSIYVGFKVTQLSEKLLDNPSFKLGDLNDIRVAIWTTTPWTIPANLAVAVNSNIEYCLVSNPNQSPESPLVKYIIAKDLMSSFSNKLGLEVTSDSSNQLIVHATMKGDDLAGVKYSHPLYDRISSIVIGGDYITTESGTGLVHTAPGHGQEDYLTGLKYNLPLLSPVNDLGCFTEEAGIQFVGLDVLGDGNIAVINALKECGALIKEEAYNHKYPYDWRTKKPTIFRATEQWFASVSNFREEALRAIDSVEWIPSVGKNRIYSMTESRGDWCISRQRSWGLPIPVFYNKNNNEPLMTPETLKHIENIFRVHGSDAWWEMSTAELLPEGSLRESADLYSKGTDTMDVWFDSGTSWAGVAQSRDELSYPVDLYLEGSDQHRGWFQSSLLTSVASQGKAPYKTVLTHGFVLDEKGYKMSKSLGNVIDPVSVIEGGSNQKENPGLGADTLRLWVSGVDYTGDVCIGQNIMKQVSDSYRKLRNTIRYLLGSLGDYDPNVHAVPYDQLPSIDKHMLGLLTSTVSEVEDAYDNYQFYRANQVILQFSSIDLSSFYLDIAKDRLYISSKDDYRRRSCQTVLATILNQLTVLIAPIVPHLAEEVYQNTPYEHINNNEVKSVFQKGWVGRTPSDRYPAFENGLWNTIRAIRNDVNKCIEIARRAKEVGANMEAQIFIHVDTSNNNNNNNSTEYYDKTTLKNILTSLQGDKTISHKPLSTNNIDDLRFLLMVSQVTIVEDLDELLTRCPDYSVLVKTGQSESGVNVGVTKANGNKCDRCWYYCESVGQVDENNSNHDNDKGHVHSDLCTRCNHVISEDGHVV